MVNSLSSSVSQSVSTNSSYPHTAEFQKPLLPVICGPDMGDYCVARLFHETYGTKSIILCDYLTGAVRHSRILQIRRVPKGHLYQATTLLPILQEIATQNPDYQPVLLGNDDAVFTLVQAYRQELEPRWLIPLPTSKITNQVNSKTGFNTLLTSLGLPTPAALTVDLSANCLTDQLHSLNALRPPLVLKPDDGANALAKFRKAGLQKVTICETLDSAQQTLHSWHTNGVNTLVCVQELIPGGDPCSWVVNGYIDATGRLQMIGSGQVLLGIHEPDLIGNAGVILVKPNSVLFTQAQKILAALNYRGLFSFDCKIDPRTGEIYWLDLNTRLGRGHYYLKAGGLNLAKALSEGRIALPPKATDPGITTSPIEIETDNQAQTQSTQSRLFAIMPAWIAVWTGGYLQAYPTLRRQARRAWIQRKVTSPFKYLPDVHPYRLYLRLGQGFNYWRRNLHYYPRPTETGF